MTEAARAKEPGGSEGHCMASAAAALLSSWHSLRATGLPCFRSAGKKLGVPVSFLSPSALICKTSWELGRLLMVHSSVSVSDCMVVWEEEAAAQASRR